MQCIAVFLCEPSSSRYVNKCTCTIVKVFNFETDTIRYCIVVINVANFPRCFLTFGVFFNEIFDDFIEIIILGASRNGLSCSNANASAFSKSFDF